MARGKALDSYQRKRDFSVTPEPAPRVSRRKGHRFVVQKHAARRLHYDFRLELDGVLKSWAVTKGPSLVPGEKRLAVHVEDHPLDYGDFEGTIPEGQYGAGTVMVWDEGSWEPDGDPHKGLAKGHLGFTLKGKKLGGRWHLVRMRTRRGETKDNWLLIKSEDEAARHLGDPDILEEKDRSVLSERRIDEITSSPRLRQWTSGKAAQEAGEAKGPRSRLRATTKEPIKKTGASRRRPEKQSIEAPSNLKKAAQLAWHPPQLALLCDKPPTDRSFIHELKFDGYRIQSIVKKGRASLWIRKGLDWTLRFRRIADDLEALGLDGLHVDGEIVVEDEKGIADFAALQMAIKRADQSHLAFYIFDLFAIEGKDTTRLPLIERKHLLEAILKARNYSPDLRYSVHFETSGDAMLEHVCRAGAEGIVSKKKDKPVAHGRNGDWLKSKCVNRQEFVVAGFVASSASSKSIGSLVLGLYEGDRLVHAGRVGSGFSHQLAQDLYKQLNASRVMASRFSDPLPREASRHVVFVEPELVAEVSFRGWTGGRVLRQASFKGIREDKDAREVKRENVTVLTGQVGAEDLRKHLTHPDRLLWQDAGITKEGLADYYVQAWHWIEPHIVNRPLALVRCPLGTGHSCFFQKHEWKGMGQKILRIRDPHDEEPLIAIKDFDGLMALVQASVLEIHPWGSNADRIKHPDRMIFDLDPGENVQWPMMIDAACEVYARLKESGLESFVKTTGGKGLHVVAPLTGSSGWDEVKAFSHKLALEMAKDTPQRFTATMAKRERSGRIFIDYLRNTRGATAVAAYSTRARPDAGISVPLGWSELTATVSAAQFTLLNIATRLEHLKADPWMELWKLRQKLPIR